MIVRFLGGFLVFVFFWFLVFLGFFNNLLSIALFNNVGICLRFLFFLFFSELSFYFFMLHMISVCSEFIRNPV